MSLACVGSCEVRLERHRIADVRRDRDRALEIAAAMRGGNRDPVRGQQSLCLSERKPAARGLAIKKRSDHRARRRPVQIGIVRGLAERPRQPFATFGRAREHGGTRLGEQVVRHARAAARGQPAVGAQHRCHNRLWLPVGDRGDRIQNGLRVAVVNVDVEDHQRIDAGIAEQLADARRRIRPVRR